MKSMEEYLVSVGPCGELEIPVAIRESLGIMEREPRVAIRMEGSKIIVTPSAELEGGEAVAE